MADKKTLMLMSDWVILISELPEDEAGRLVKAMCTYQLTGELPDTDPVVGAMLKMITPVMDDNNAKYEAKVERLSQNASKSHSKKKQIEHEKEANRSRKGSKSEGVPVPVSVPDTLKESINPPKSPLDDLSPKVREQMERWLQYKKERKEAYKPVGLQSVVSQVRKKVNEFGEDAVVDVIELSMSNQWRGIIWEKIKPPDKGRLPDNDDGLGEMERLYYANNLRYTGPDYFAGSDSA